MTLWMVCEINPKEKSSGKMSRQTKNWWKFKSLIGEFPRLPSLNKGLIYSETLQFFSARLIVPISLNDGVRRTVKFVKKVVIVHRGKYS